MISIKKPTEEAVRQFLQQQEQQNFTYVELGATLGTPPAGFVVDHNRAQLGTGRHVFESAKAALRRWDQFKLGWVEVLPREAPIRQGQLVAIVATAVGLWWVNPCRIISVIEEEQPTRRFGFAYGTLPSHAGRGEERFLVEWNPADDRVWFDVLAFSRPNHFWAKLGYPIMRQKQRRFGKESIAAMRREC